MPDPSIAWLTPVESTIQTTTFSFSAQPAGTLLVLDIMSDDALMTSGANRPESSGWTLGITETAFANHSLFFKLTNGSETSVDYKTQTGAFRSIAGITTATNIDQVTPLDVAVVGQFNNGTGTSYTTPNATPTTGRRLGVAAMGFSHGTTAITLQDTWLNSYVEAGDFLSTAAPFFSLGVATLTFDASGGTTSSGSSIVTQAAQSQSGILAVFRVASTQDPDVPILRPRSALNTLRM